MCTLNFSNKLNLKRKKEIDTPSPFISLAKSRQVLIGLSGQDILVKVTLFAGVQSFGENICHRCDQDKYISPEYICSGHICPGYHQKQIQTRNLLSNKQSLSCEEQKTIKKTTQKY